MAAYRGPDDDLVHVSGFSWRWAERRQEEEEEEEIDFL